MQAIVVANDQDEKDILSFILRKDGLSVASSSDAQRVLKNWSEHPADLMLVALSDQPKPEVVVDSVRAITQVPLLMLVDTLSEKALCDLLKRGADVVLQRPVSPQVLLAYVQAMMRRSGTIPSFVLPTLALVDITLDPSTRSVRVFNGEPRRLTQLEFRLLYTLMTNRGQVVPLDVIVERVWGYTGEGNQDLVRGLISRLRRKIEPDPEGSHFIETVAGVGYRFSVGDI